MPPISLRDQIAELKRELAMRARVYPGQIARGHLSALEADRRTGRLVAALASLENIAEARFKAEALAAHASRR